MSLKCIYFELETYFLGANELIHCGLMIPYGDIDMDDTDVA